MRLSLFSSVCLLLLSTACGGPASDPDPGMMPDMMRPDGGLTPPVITPGIPSPVELNDVAPDVACPANAEEVLNAAAEAFAQAMESDQVTGGAIGFLCGGEVMLMRPIGTVQADGEPVDVATRFEIASVTKTLTGLTAARLHEEDMIDLSATIESILPEITVRYQDGDEAPTLEQLLAHTAGYPADPPSGIEHSADTVLDSMIALTEHPLMSPPGALFNYSNYGYALVAAALERATSMPFVELVKEYVIDEAQMPNATIVAAEVVDSGNFALGHSSYESDPLGPLDSYYHQPTEAAMGGGWASVEDLLRFAHHLIQREHVESAELPISEQRPNTQIDISGYGLGLSVETGGSHDLWYHSGSIPGFLTDLQIVPELGFAVVTLVNNDQIERREEYAVAGTLMRQLTDFEYVPYADPTAEDIASWAGTYIDPIALGTITVTVDGMNVTAEIDGNSIEVQPWAPRIGEATLPGDPEPVELNFWNGPSGEIEYLATQSGVAVRQ